MKDIYVGWSWILLGARKIGHVAKACCLSTRLKLFAEGTTHRRPLEGKPILILLLLCTADASVSISTIIRRFLIVCIDPRTALGASPLSF